jgi:hypothetical protein
MRRLSVAIVTGACALATCAQANAAHPSCRHAPADALLITTTAIRVFNLANGTYYACARRPAARPLVLATEFDYTHEVDQVGLVDAKGAFVAFEEHYYDYASDESTVNVWDVIHRKQRWHIPTGVADPTRCPSYYGTGELSDLALKRDGAVAWITDDHPCAIAPGQEVHRADRRGTTLLMSALAVRGGSLRLLGSALSWLVGKSRRTTDLR